MFANTSISNPMLIWSGLFTSNLTKLVDIIYGWPLNLFVLIVGAAKPSNKI